MTDIKIRVIPSEDPRLGRNVVHDERSRAYAFKAPRGIELKSVRHTRFIPVLDQGNLGSCTGNTGIGAMGTNPSYPIVVPSKLAHDDLNQDAAILLYSEASAIDPWPGSYPPDDTGSSGLAIAKILKGRGWVSGYRHTFTFEDMCAALQETPVMLGINWYDSFYNPRLDGEMIIEAGSVPVGGHEIIVDEIDVERKRIWITNSWGRYWGLDGRGWFSFDTMKRLLAEDGDVVVLIPLDQPAPQPTPSDDVVDETVELADKTLWEAVKVWAGSRRYGENKKAQKAVKEWAEKKGLTS